MCRGGAVQIAVAASPLGRRSIGLESGPLDLGLLGRQCEASVEDPSAYKLSSMRRLSQNRDSSFANCERLRETVQIQKQFEEPPSRLLLCGLRNWSSTQDTARATASRKRPIAHTEISRQLENPARFACGTLYAVDRAST